MYFYYVAVKTADAFLINKKKIGSKKKVGRVGKVGKVGKEGKEGRLRE
jgi:hypothetical protein